MISPSSTLSEARLVPRRISLDVLDRGDSVPFGPYTLAPAGVQWRSSLIAWSDIEKFQLDDDGGNEKRSSSMV
jgi:hypothetical protein